MEDYIALLIFGVMIALTYILLSKKIVVAELFIGLEPTDP